VGKLAQLADAAVVVSYGDTVVLATVCVTESPMEVDFLPLRVDFEEKMYAVGRIPGGFFKREGRPSEEATLICRKIDRPLRPLLPSGLRNDVQVIVNPLSAENANSVDIVAMIAGAAAMHLSSVPFDGPMSAARVGRVNGEYIVSPSFEQQSEAELDVVVAVGPNGLVQMEMDGAEIPEDAVVEATRLAMEACEPVRAAIEELRQLAGKPKGDYPLWEPRPEILQYLRDNYTTRLQEAVLSMDKLGRDREISALRKQAIAELSETFERPNPDVAEGVEIILKEYLKKLAMVEGKRADGRALDEIRDLSAEVGFLPRVHGSGLFTRGATQVLTTTTLGAVSDQRMVRTLEEEEYTPFMHHYNFPPFSTGEVRGLRGTGRREIGHGSLAKKALERVLPPPEDFPYTIRLVSEVLQANASTSMAAVCGSTLALMDAGVPIKAPVAGISVGLIYEDAENYRLLSDMQALEDFMGGMDFKVAGTRTGVNCIQMDTKTDGVSLVLVAEALQMARTARLQVLDVMAEALPYPREELSRYAPRMLALIVDKEQIGLIIGPGGRNIRKLQDMYAVQIDIEDDGTVRIFGENAEGVQSARDIIFDLTRTVEIGEVFEGTVTSTTDFGAFVELLPGREGLVHISHLSWDHVNKTTDVVSAGDKMEVKVIDVDSDGKIRLSRKELLPRPPGAVDSGSGGRPSGGRPSGGGGRSGGGSRPSGGGGGRSSGGDGEDRGKPYFRKKQ
jgi:polyribonucleotide nucleotidyltransferase